MTKILFSLSGFNKHDDDLAEVVLDVDGKLTAYIVREHLHNLADVDPNLEGGEYALSAEAAEQIFGLLGIECNPNCDWFIGLATATDQDISRELLRRQR